VADFSKILNRPLQKAASRAPDDGAAPPEIAVNMSHRAARVFAGASGQARSRAAKLCMLTSLNSPKILMQRLFDHRSDFAPAQNALPTLAKV
jgi:hypothetical protein